MDGFKHLLGGGLAEARPAQVVVAGTEHRIFNGLIHAGSLVFVGGVDLDEPPDEQQVGELLDDGEGVSDAASPHGIPNAVDFRLEFSGDHGITVV